MRKVPNIRFYIDSKQREKELIYLAFSLNNKIVKFSTGQSVPPKVWDKKLQRIKNGSAAKDEDLQHINQMLDDFAVLAKSILRERILTITAEEFKTAFEYQYYHKEEKKPKVPTFLEFIDQFYQEKVGMPNIKEGTCNVFSTISKIFKEYAETNEPLHYDTFDYQFKTRFESYCYGVKEYSSNYTHKIFSILKQILLEAQKRGFHNNNAYTFYSIKKQQNLKIVLSQSEIEQMALYNFSANNRL
jgi:hypothetical protein